jgi:hypothetical protein
VWIVQSHLLNGESPTFGPVHANLVEYGIARLREGPGQHKGQIVEPLAFLSLMKWLEKTNGLSEEARLRLRLADQAARGSAFEDVGILYLLRALRERDRAPFTSVFNFQTTPSWANKEYHIVARLDKDDVPVDALRKYPQNPGLSAVHYASCIEDIIDWIDRVDTTPAVLIPCGLFGPDVLVRCRSSSDTTVPRNVLLIGQFKSYTVGNIDSLDAKTLAGALTTLHPTHWFKQAVCYLVSLLFSSH